MSGIKISPTEASRGKALSLVKSLRSARTEAMAAAAVAINAASKKGFIETAVSLEKQARGMSTLSTAWASHHYLHWCLTRLVQHGDWTASSTQREENLKAAGAKRTLTRNANNFSISSSPQAANLKLIKTKWFHPGSNWGSFACEANGLANFPMEPNMKMKSNSRFIYIMTTDSVPLCSQSAARSTLSRPWVTLWADAHHLAAATAAVCRGGWRALWERMREGLL